MFLKEALRPALKKQLRKQNAKIKAAVAKRDAAREKNVKAAKEMDVEGDADDTASSPKESKESSGTDVSDPNEGEIAEIEANMDEEDLEKLLDPV